MHISYRSIQRYWKARLSFIECGIIYTGPYKNIMNKFTPISWLLLGTVSLNLGWFHSPLIINLQACEKNPTENFSTAILPESSSSTDLLAPRLANNSWYEDSFCSSSSSSDDETTYFIIKNINNIINSWMDTKVNVPKSIMWYMYLHIYIVIVEFLALPSLCGIIIYIHGHLGILHTCVS